MKALSAKTDYPEEYRMIRPVREQIEILAEFFGLDPKHSLWRTKSMPSQPYDGSEGWLVVPKLDALAAKRFPGVVEGEKYRRAVLLANSKLAESRGLVIGLHDLMIPGRLSVREHTRRALDQIARNQKGPFLVISAQLGRRRCGHSVLMNRRKLAVGEFGLGSLAVACAILTHPKRFVHHGDMGIDCAGDEFDPDGDRCFSAAPNYGCGRSGEIIFGVADIKEPTAHFGSATGYSP